MDRRDGMERDVSSFRKVGRKLVVRDCWVPWGMRVIQSVGMLFSHTMSRSARNFWCVLIRWVTREINNNGQFKESHWIITFKVARCRHANGSSGMPKKLAIE